MRASEHAPNLVRLDQGERRSSCAYFHRSVIQLSNAGNARRAVDRACFSRILAIVGSISLACPETPRSDGRPGLLHSHQWFNGAQGRNRTTDTAIFSRMLYQLSYLGVLFAAKCEGGGYR
jgi:hypothetical protein